LIRVVHDTNVVLSALLFGGRLDWLRAAWAGGRIVPVVCAETVRELMRVLAYPKFRLTAEDRTDLLADYLPHAETARLPARLPRLPSCRDPADRVFLALAKTARAEALVTGDRDLLALAGDFVPPILTPDALHARLAAAG
jgi:putative PIN family toxin of toxin-antitoxin system